MGRTAIQFLTPHAPWFSNAPWGVVLPLIIVFCLLKGRGPLKKFKKLAEMLRKIRPIDWYHWHPPSLAIKGEYESYSPLTQLRLQEDLISLYFCHVSFHEPCGLPRDRLPYISATCSSMRYAACRAPGFHIFLPRVLPCAMRLAARQTSKYFWHVLPCAIPSYFGTFQTRIGWKITNFCRAPFFSNAPAVIPVAAQLFTLMRTLGAGGFLQDL